MQTPSQVEYRPRSKGSLTVVGGCGWGDWHQDPILTASFLPAQDRGSCSAIVPLFCLHFIGLIVDCLIARGRKQHYFLPYNPFSSTLLSFSLLKPTTCCPTGTTYLATIPTASFVLGHFATLAQRPRASPRSFLGSGPP